VREHGEAEFHFTHHISSAVWTNTDARQYTAASRYARIAPHYVARASRYASADTLQLPQRETFISPGSLSVWVHRAESLADRPLPPEGGTPLALSGIQSSARFTFLEKPGDSLFPE
jgi:hypothetical protein